MKQLIGLYNLEPQIENTALMQVSQYHKDMGDKVEMYNHILYGMYDKVYAFSIFDFTDKSMVRPNMICGGTGFNVKTKLPKEIEECDLDYSIYPNCNTSYIWFSRGCIRNCPWCIVRKKEGYIYPIENKNFNPKADTIKVMDNNFFANPEWPIAMNLLQRYTKQRVEFLGIDIRILEKDMITELKKLKYSYHNSIKFAWDNPKDDIHEKLELITSMIKPYKLMCYVLIGFPGNSTEETDLYRVETLRSYNVDPFVIPYNKYRLDQQRFARWVNRKELFKSVSWEEYKKNAIQKGIV